MAVVVAGPWGCALGAVTGADTDPTERERVVIKFAPAEGSDWMEGAVRETAEHILSRLGPEVRASARPSTCYRRSRWRPTR